MWWVEHRDQKPPCRTETHRSNPSGNVPYDANELHNPFGVNQTSASIVRPGSEVRRAMTCRRGGVSDILHPLLVRAVMESTRGRLRDVQKAHGLSGDRSRGNRRRRLRSPGSRLTPLIFQWVKPRCSTCAHKKASKGSTQTAVEATNRVTDTFNACYLISHHTSTMQPRIKSRNGRRPLPNQPHSAELTVPIALHGQFRTVRRTSIRQCSQASYVTPARYLALFCVPYLDWSHVASRPFAE